MVIGRYLMTVQLGTGHGSGKELWDAIKEGGGRVSDWAKNVLRQKAFRVQRNPTTLDLFVVSVEELGYPDGEYQTAIYKRALERGFSLVPAEAGPQVRLQYMNQPRGERLLMGMPPIVAAHGYGNIFVVGHGDNLFLDSRRSHDDFSRG